MNSARLLNFGSFILEHGDLHVHRNGLIISSVTF